MARVLLSISEGRILFSDLEDHGLPLVQLKEQRRDLVVALMGHRQSVASHIIVQIAAIQQTIAAIKLSSPIWMQNFKALTMQGIAASLSLSA